jgi:hypothetical protein
MLLPHTNVTLRMLLRIGVDPNDFGFQLANNNST